MLAHSKSKNQTLCYTVECKNVAIYYNYAAIYKFYCINW